MIQAPKKYNLKMSFLERDEDSLLFLIDNGNIEYCMFCEEEQWNKQIPLNFSNFNLIQKEDLSDREYEIAKYLFMFLWNSENGVSTGCEQDIYEDDGFTRKEMVNFVEKINNLVGEEVLEITEDTSNTIIEIMWSYLCSFELKSMNFWGENNK